MMTARQGFWERNNWFWEKVATAVIILTLITLFAVLMVYLDVPPPGHFADVPSGE